ncbi:19449_t:CDS:2, partial [Racocetra persica]
FCLLIYRYGKLVAADEAAFPTWNDTAEITETYLYQFYQNNLPPTVLYTAKKMPEIKLLGEELGFICKSPQRGRKKEQVNKRQVLTEIGNFLSIQPLNYIECLDISNLYKQDIVAGFLAFINGEKNLAQSKLYKLENEANKNSELAEPPTEATSDLTRIKKA